MSKEHNAVHAVLMWSLSDSDSPVTLTYFPIDGMGPKNTFSLHGLSVETS